MLVAMLLVVGCLGVDDELLYGARENWEPVLNRTVGTVGAKGGAKSMDVYAWEPVPLLANWMDSIYEDGLMKDWNGMKGKTVPIGQTEFFLPSGEEYTSYIDSVVDFPSAYAAMRTCFRAETGKGISFSVLWCMNVPRDSVLSYHWRIDDDGDEWGSNIDADPLILWIRIQMNEDGSIPLIEWRRIWIKYRYCADADIPDWWTDLGYTSADNRGVSGWLAWMYPLPYAYITEYPVQAAEGHPYENRRLFSLFNGRTLAPNLVSFGVENGMADFYGSAASLCDLPAEFKRWGQYMEGNTRLYFPGDNSTAYWWARATPKDALKAWFVHCMRDAVLNCEVADDEVFGVAGGQMAALDAGMVDGVPMTVDSMQEYAQMSASEKQQWADNVSARDWDGDGWSNAFERKHHYDYTSFFDRPGDMDGDGYLDSLDCDTDGDGTRNAQDLDDDNDGWTDEIEILKGTSPWNPLDNPGDGPVIPYRLGEDAARMGGVGSSGMIATYGSVVQTDSSLYEPPVEGLRWDDPAPGGLMTFGAWEPLEEPFQSKFNLELTEPLDPGNTPYAAENDALYNVAGEFVPDPIETPPIDSVPWRGQAPLSNDVPWGPGLAESPDYPEETSDPFDGWGEDVGDRFAPDATARFGDMGSEEKSDIYIGGGGITQAEVYDAITDAIGWNTLPQAGSATSDVVQGAGAGVGDVSGGPVSGLINSLQPGTVTSGDEFSFTIPRPGGGDYVFTFPMIPDATMEGYDEFMVGRGIMRAFLAMLMLYTFSRSVMRLMEGA